jgi:segregation and condensation protein B
VTSDAFLDHFGLESVDALPGVEELRAAGLLDVRSAVSALGAQALSDTARTSIQDRNDTDASDEERGDEPAEDELDEAALVAALGDLPEED